jgi:putative ABC transport system permease protein
MHRGQIVIRHFLSSALANIARAPFTTAANVVTLTLGLACFIAAFGIATYWQSADNYREKVDRTFMVGQSLKPLNDPSPDIIDLNSTATLARYLREDFPEISQVARAYAEPDLAVATEKRTALLNAAVVDQAFLDLFDFHFVAGDPARALSQPFSAILTQNAATRLFGAAPALGRTILVDNDRKVVVVGVIAPVRQPSFMGAASDAVLRFDMLLDWASTPGGAVRDANDNWRTANAMTFMLLRNDVSIKAFNLQLSRFVGRRLPVADKSVLRMALRAFPIREIARRSIDDAFLSQTGFPVTAVVALVGLGLLTLFVASLNYANLSTAQYESRFQEIGLRRVVGAGRGQLLLQVWIETAVLVAIALTLAITALAMAAPALQHAVGANVLYFMSHAFMAAAILSGLLVIVTIGAGAYPALVYSGVSPARALRAGRSGTTSGLAPSILVAIQFASASFLLILVTISQLQSNMLRDIATSSQKDPVVVLNDLRELKIDFKLLESRLTGERGIKSISLAWAPPWSGARIGMTLIRTADGNAAGAPGFWSVVGFDYFQTLGLKLVAGRSFDRALDARYADWSTPAPQGPRPIVVDETLAERLGFASPAAAINQTVYLPRQDGPPTPEIIVGVVQSEVWGFQAGQALGSYYSVGVNAPFDGQVPLVRISRNDVTAALRSISSVWKELAPSVPANIRFYDELFKDAYRQYARVGQLFILLASVAFIISTMGLLGIAVHAASQKRHEIAVRKTLGSSVARIVRLLLTDFSIPVLIGNLLAWPLAYLAAQAYLSVFAHRIDLTPAPFLLSLLITLAIACAAVIGVVLKAASLRPAEVLRNA